MKILPNVLEGGTLVAVETVRGEDDLFEFGVANCTVAEVVGSPVATDLLRAAIL